MYEQENLISICTCILDWCRNIHRHPNFSIPNDEALPQEWTFPKSCDVFSQTKPSNWKTHHARNIARWHISFLLQRKKIHIMWISPCTLTYWCTKPSTKHKSTKHASSNNWLSSQIIAHVQISIFVAFKCVNITLPSTSCFMQHAPYFEFAKKFMKHQNTCKALIGWEI